MAALLGAFAFSGLSACTEEPEPIDGGNTIHQDPDAPKEITSKEITDYEASFCVFTRWSDEEHEDNTFLFTVKKDENGVLTAYEENRGISYPADEELLISLQEIIDRYELVKLNGLYDVTAGLAPEYQPGGMTVNYASGENLTFTTDNNPYALWSEETYDVFAAWFAEKGDDTLYPPVEGAVDDMTRCVYRFNGMDYSYSIRTGQDGEAELERNVYDPAGSRDISEERTALPDDFFARITEILVKHRILRSYEFSTFNHEEVNYSNHDLGFYGMGGTPDYSEPDSEDSMVILHVRYENGNRMNIDTKKESEIQGMHDMLEELLGYMDSLF